MPWLRCFAILLVLAASPGISRADFSDMGRTMQNINFAQQNIFRESLRYAQSNAARREALGAAPSVDHHPLSATDFKPRKGHPVVDAWLSQSGLDDEQQGEMRAAILAGFAMLDDSGARPHNLATSAAHALATAIYILDGTAIDDAGFDQLVASVNDAIASNPAFAKMPAKTRAATAESLRLSTVLMLQFAQLAPDDASMKDAADALARVVFVSLTGTDPGA